MRPITGQVRLIRGGAASNLANTGALFYQTDSGQYLVNFSDGTSSQALSINFASARLGTNFSGTDTHGENISLPVILYLGRPAA
jgi:hypothetical protein